MPLTDSALELSPRRSPAWEAAAWIGGGLALIVAMVVWAWPVTEEKRSAFSVEVSDSTPARTSRGPYVGSKVCGECHASELAAFEQSGHARTLGIASASPVARRLDGRVVADPDRPEVTWTYGLRDGVFQVQRSEKGNREVERFVLEYVLGSGDHAATFVTVTDQWKPIASEHRLTYYAESDSFDVTPGQRAENPVSGTTHHSRELSPRETRKCFGCHTTPASEATATAPGQAPIANAERLSPNVSCEQCHGPARAHIEAARQGRADLTMPFAPDQWTAESQLGLCGQCHRHPSRFPAERIRPDDAQLARFQPIGLMQSKCYTKSQGALSCVTCHNPHERASKEPTAYEAACLGCHDGRSTPTMNGTRVCPVSPSKSCLDCHMPKLDSGQHVLYTDHWIRVRETDRRLLGRPKEPSPSSE